MSVEQRFWSKVDKRGPGECWRWLGRKNAKGYGSFDDETDKQVRAHRYALKLAGVIIPDGCEPDHTCYNADCVNPAHLDMVTGLENIRRGRARRARLCQATDTPATHNASLTADQVRLIRSYPRNYRKLSKALAYLGLSKWAINDVRTGNSYVHIL